MIWTLSERAIRHDRFIAALERQVPKRYSSSLLILTDLVDKTNEISKTFSGWVVIAIELGIDTIHHFSSTPYGF